MNLPSNPVREERGLSLIELLVAVTMLSVGALGAITLQRSVVVANQQSDSREVAVSLSRQLLEASRTAAYASLLPTNGWTAPPTSLSPANPLNGQGESAVSGYTRDWQISAGPRVNTRTIRVRTRWNRRGRSHEVQLATVRAWE